MSGITPGWGSQWETLVSAINGYYGGGVESAAYQKVIQMLNSGNYSMSEMEGILGQIPEFNRVYNANGELINVSYNATASAANTSGAIAGEINSNVAAATQTQFKTVQTITKDAATDTVTISDTVTKYSGGVAGTGKFITGSVIPAVLATGVGIALGKAIDSALYNANPDFWDSHGMQALNPEVWNTIMAGQNTFGANVFNMILGIDGDTNNPQPYIDETTFAYLTAYMASQNLFSSEGSYNWNGVLPTGFSLIQPITHNESAFVGTVNGVPRNFYNWGSYWHYDHTSIIGIEYTEYHDDYKVTSGINTNENNKLYGLICSKTDFSGTNQFAFNPSTMEFDGSGTTYHGSFTHDGKTVYYTGGGSFDNATTSYGTALENFTYMGQLAWVLQYGDFTLDGLPGVTNQPGANVFDPSSISDFSNIASILALLKLAYPELWNNRVEVSPDGSTTITYIPIGFPTGGEGNKPTTGGGTQKDLKPDIEGKGDSATDELIKTLIDIIQNDDDNDGMEDDTETPPKPVNPNPGDTGTGDTPTVIIPTGTAKSLFAIYNPSQSEVDSFGAWLWSPAFVDQLLKLFNDPMQSIIGLHKIFATPTISGRGTIHVGYLDSGVSTNIVGSQYVTISCGSVSLSEYFRNVFDYDPFTDVHIYLPFIGIEKLNVGDVMRSTIEVVYHVDVITGACLAEIKVTRDLSGGTLYTYSGNCAVQYPISAGSYMGIVASIASIAGGVVGTIASGGALAPMALGAVNGALNAHTKVQHSGGFSGNSGAMGIKKPYLIISRPQTALAQLFPSFDGYPANESVILSQCTGFTQVESCHIVSSATSEEITEIEMLLKEGVII